MYYLNIEIYSNANISYNWGMTEYNEQDSLLIECPSCGHEFSLSAAVLARIQAKTETEMRDKWKTQQAALARQSKENEALAESIRKQQEALDAKSEKVDELVAARLKEMEADTFARAEAKAAAKIKDHYALELKELKSERDDKAKALAESQTQELELRKQQRKLAEEKDQLELRVQRTLDEEREKIREAAVTQAAEAQARKLAEKDHVVDSLKKQIEEMRRKAEQGSMQVQGESLEIDLENALREAFPADELSEVPKGIRGADLLLSVRSPSGRKAGVIAIEIKQTKNWSEGWVSKLKEDQRQIAADLGIIVTSVLPSDIDRFGQRDGVWVCDIPSFVALVSNLRWALLEVNAQRVANENRGEKMEVLFHYITGTEFRQKVEGLLEAFDAMRSDLDKERRSMERIWSSRAKAIEQAVRHTAAMFGDVQTLSGGSLTGIASLELEEAVSS